MLYRCKGRKSLLMLNRIIPYKDFFFTALLKKIRSKQLLVLFDFDTTVGCIIKKYTKQELINDSHLGRIVKTHKYR